jgi:hypothetical protein
VGLITALILVSVGVIIGYAYFHYRKKPSDHLADQDYIDCSDKTTSKSELATCYIDRKSMKIKKELGLTD